MSYDHKRQIILTVDVEDNFTREELCRDSDWTRYEAQVVDNTLSVVHFLQSIRADATFFVLGKVAQRHPKVVTTIHEAGFEVASHGYSHEIVGSLGKHAFEEDLKMSLDILQSITSKKVDGFRARSFSITRDTLWALDILDSYGLIYDSSILDGELYTITNSTDSSPQRIMQHQFTEFPVSTFQISGKRMPIGGGVVFRLLPQRLLEYLIKRSTSFTDNPMIYSHVWEFNKNQPKRRIGVLQSLAQSPKTYTTREKIQKLNDSYNFISVRKYLSTSSD